MKKKEQVEKEHRVCPQCFRDFVCNKDEPGGRMCDECAKDIIFDEDEPEQ